MSSHELNQPGTYKDVKDTSAVAMFTIDDKKNTSNKNYADIIKSAPKGASVSIMAWTTTPWTLPSNLGLTVGANIEYELIQSFNPYTSQPCNVILAKPLVSKYFKEEAAAISFEEYKAGDKLIPWKSLASFHASFSSLASTS